MKKILQTAYTEGMLLLALVAAACVILPPAAVVLVVADDVTCGFCIAPLKVCGCFGLCSHGATAALTIIVTRLGIYRSETNIGITKLIVSNYGAIFIILYILRTLSVTECSSL